MKYYLSLAVLCFLLTACSSGNSVPKGQEFVERPLDDIYTNAQRQLIAGNLDEAVDEFEEVERQHPHSSWASRAQIMAAYVYFLDEKYDEAVLTLERFIELNPSSEYTSYAYYLQAISHYTQITSVDRDQKASYDALQAFDQVLARYGDSIYARDSRLKRDLVVDHLAGKEIEVGLYYLKRDEYAAAINRFRAVIDRLEATSHVPEALARLVEAYVSIGLLNEAIRTTAVLQYNFSDNYWYEYAHSLLADAGAVAPQADANRDWSGYKFKRGDSFTNRRANVIDKISAPPIEVQAQIEEEAASAPEQEKGFSLFDWF